MDDLAALWQYARGLLNSNAFTAIAGSCAGAFAGAWAAQRIAARGKERDDFLAEIRNTSAATVVALSICNSFLSIKKQHVKRLKDTFDKQKADYLDRVQKYRSGQLARNDTAPPLLFDLQALVLPPFCVAVGSLAAPVVRKNITGKSSAADACGIVERNCRWSEYVDQ